MNRTSLAFTAVFLLLAAGCRGASKSDAPNAAIPATTGVSRPAPSATASDAAPAQPQLPVTVKDKDGRAITVNDASRVLALNGEITEIVFALGLGDSVVGIDTSATYPERVQTLPSVGYQRALSAEGVLALRPSVIIGNENAGPPAVIEQLRGAGVPVVIIKYSASIDDVPAKIQTVAQAVGLGARGDQLAGTTRAEIEAAKALAAKSSSRPKVAFLNVRGAGTQQVWGKGTSSNSMIVAAGGVDAAAQAGIDGSKPLTAEALVTAAPDTLLVLTAALDSVGGTDGLLQIPGVAQTPAGRNRRVVSFEDQYLLGMGPRAGQALTELVKTLHPDLK